MSDLMSGTQREPLAGSTWRYDRWIRAAALPVLASATYPPNGAQVTRARQTPQRGGARGVTLGTSRLGIGAASPKRRGLADAIPADVRALPVPDDKLESCL